MKKLALILFTFSIAYSQDYPFRANVVPGTTNTYDLGRSWMKWDTLYVRYIPWVTDSLGNHLSYMQANRDSITKPVKYHYQSISTVTGLTDTLARKYDPKDTVATLLTQANAATKYLTSVSATSPVQSTGGLTPHISMVEVGTESDGYLSSADWTEFKGKLNKTDTTYLHAGKFAAIQDSIDRATDSLQAHNERINAKENPLSFSYPLVRVGDAVRHDSSNTGNLNKNQTWTGINSFSQAIEADIKGSVYGGFSGGSYLEILKSNSSDAVIVSDTGAIFNTYVGSNHLFFSMDGDGLRAHVNYNVQNFPSKSGTFLLDGDSTNFRSASDSKYQPIENQRLSTSNSPAFSSLYLNSTNTILNYLGNQHLIGGNVSFRTVGGTVKTTIDTTGSVYTEYIRVYDSIKVDNLARFNHVYADDFNTDKFITNNLSIGDDYTGGASTSAEDAIIHLRTGNGSQWMQWGLKVPYGNTDVTSPYYDFCIRDEVNNRNVLIAERATGMANFPLGIKLGVGLDTAYLAGTKYHQQAQATITALTDTLAQRLPSWGGTLTGGLSGTSLNMSGSGTFGGNVIVNNEGTGDNVPNLSIYGTLVNSNGSSFSEYNSLYFRGYTSNAAVSEIRNYGNLYFQNGSRLKFFTSNSSRIVGLALTLDEYQNATFSGTLSADSLHSTKGISATNATFSSTVTADSLTITNGLNVFGDLKYNFRHVVASADSVSYSPTVNQWSYTRLVPGMTAHEADGITFAGDSLTILSAGDYKIDVSISSSGANQNDYWRVKVYKNSVAMGTSVGRFRWKTTAAGQSDTRSYFWYLPDLAAGDKISFWITNETASRNPTITDMKIYAEKKPE